MIKFLVILENFISWRSNIKTPKSPLLRKEIFLVQPARDTANF